MNAIHPESAIAAGPSMIAAPQTSAQAIMDDASMAELVTLGRLFFAAINCCDTGESEGAVDDEERHQRDDRMSVLANFDDELSSLICARKPRTAEEYGVKAAYLFARLRGGGMSDAVDDEALQALECDARVMACLISPEPLA
jgi:hypothetical protein